MMNRRKRMGGVALSVVSAACLSHSASANAFADPPAAARLRVATKLLGANEIADASSDRSKANERARAEKDLLDESANNGTLVDAEEVSSSVLDDTAVAWTDNVEVQEVVVARADVSGRPGRVDGSALGLGVVAENGPSSVDVAIADLGSTATSGVSGRWGDTDGGTVTVTKGAYKIVSGWERYRIKESKTDREIYYYGHWITAYGQDVRLDYDHSPKILDIRSRPKSGYASTFLQVRNYWPKVSQPACNSSGNLSIEAYGFGASLPMQNCSNLDPDVDTNTKTMKVVWNAGTCNDSRVEGADLGMVVDVKPGRKAILSDYAYAQFSSQGRCDVYSPDNTRIIYADPGW